jgi:flagellar biosynthesis/type III secretory pathway M-ring protein FliF/YscJ
MEKTIDFYDIYDYYQVPFWQEPWFWAICTLSLLAVALIAIYWLKHRKAVKLTAWQRAYARLDELKPASYTTQKEFKNFYYTLTQIVKEYLHERFTWQTLDKTDDELLALLQEKDFSHEAIKQLEALIAAALNIKYARTDALKTQAITHKEFIITLITTTIPHQQ